MFIVIDGIDGSGKATQLGLVSDFLKNLGKKVKILDYPRYGEKSSFFVKKYLSGEYGNDISAKQASIFYALDRFDNYKSYENEVGDYDYIISNRYVSANIIHQASKIKNLKERKEFIKWLENLEYDILQIPKPDLTIFLNVTPSLSSVLVEKRGNKKDIHESDEKHMLNAYKIANQVVDSRKDWIKIDCEKNNKILDKKIIRDLILKEII